jgi:hypothetical protein
MQKAGAGNGDDKADGVEQRAPSAPAGSGRYDHGSGLYQGHCQDPRTGHWPAAGLMIARDILRDAKS